MTEVPNPDQPTSLPPTNIGDKIYAYLPGSDPSIRTGVVKNIYASDAWVEVGKGYSLRIHRSKLFTPREVAYTALDLMLSHPAGDEVHVSKAIEEVIEHPLAGYELATRLDLETIERYTASARTLEELGLRSKEDLLADAKTYGSNHWKIAHLIEGINSGELTGGEENELNLAMPTRDLEVLPAQEAAAARQKIYELNRRVLDTLYDQYGANFDEAVVLERTEGRVVERRTVIPSTIADFSFVETTYVHEDEAANPTSPHIDWAQIVVGKPESEEKGYTPAI